jgi:lysophospholipase L1-like esterase
MPPMNFEMLRCVAVRSCVLTGLLCVLMLSARAEPNPHWLATWAAPPDSTQALRGNQTLRQVVRVSIGGDAVRLRISNLFGATPLTLGPVRVARHSVGSGIRPGSGMFITFGGKRTVIVPKGADVLSDPVPMSIAALEKLAVSMYLPRRVASATVHSTGYQTAYLSKGEATAAHSLPRAKTSTSRYFLTDVEVSSRREAHAFVIVGDSLSDGDGSTVDANARWPDVLAERLQADASMRHIAVVNSGISGNLLLHAAVDPYVGPSMLSRFERDALSKPGVRWVMVFAGITDISSNDMLGAESKMVTAQHIIGGLQSLIARARAQGLKVWGATMGPYVGVEEPFFSAAGEAMRQEVNHWIRTAGAYDVVVDFEEVIRDPAQPDRLRPAVDSGDHLHPNDAGYRLMGEAIDLRLLK